MQTNSSPSLRIKHLEELLEIKYEKLSEFEKELAITASPAQKFELRQRLKREVFPDLRKHEVEYAQLLAQHADQAAIPPQKAEAVLAEIQHAVEQIEQLPAAPPDEVKQLLADVRKKLDDPGKAAAAKLKVTLPIIPLIVSYEMELDTEGFLTQAWRGLKSLFGGKV